VNHPLQVRTRLGQPRPGSVAAQRGSPRKKHQHVEIAGEKAFGKGNIWTLSSSGILRIEGGDESIAASRTNPLFNLGVAPTFERKHAQSVEGILSGYSGNLRLG
jgi:hypothetical protein